MIDISEKDYELFLKFKAMLALEQNNDVQAEQKKKRKITKHRRSRGTGTITKLSGKRNKPFVAKITTGYDNDKGRQIQEVVGYFKSYQDAELALNRIYLQKNGLVENVAHGPTVTSVANKCPTFKEIWDIVYDEHVSKKSNSTRAGYRVAFKHLKSIWNKSIDKITLHDLQPIFDQKMKEGSSEGKLRPIKIVCSLVFNYAMKYDYIAKDYSQFIKYEDTSKIKNKAKPFTKEEIKKLFELNTYESKLILIYIYTGLRPQELLKITPDKVFIKEQYMMGGIKTKNGIDRMIPLHRCIVPFVQELLMQNHEYLVMEKTGLRAYELYRTIIFPNGTKSITETHGPYDTRHTFATLCNEHELNDFLVKKIMGHSCKDLTKDVYTHATIERLVAEVNKLPDLSKAE